MVPRMADAKSQLSPRIAKENTTFPLDSYFFHPRIRIVFLAIPKVGCSAIKRWMISQVEPEALGARDVNVHGYALEHFALSAKSDTDAATILSEFPVVGFVRPPLERLRSAFIDKFVRPTASELFPPARELLEDWFRTNKGSCADFERRISFREFVEFVVEADRSHLDRHWRPQSSFLVSETHVRLLPISEIGRSLDAISSQFGPDPVSTDPINVTRKEPSHRVLLADAPAGELHRDNLRPPAHELADAAIRQLISSRLGDDEMLVQRARENRVNGSSNR
jgi:hypothetical protein